MENTMTKRRTTMIAGLSIATVITGGALAAAAMPAVAETNASASSGATATTAPTAPDPSTGGHQANGITEELLTGDVADKVEAAVLAEYPDATIQRLETDAEGSAYEAHIQQADGTQATVKLDESFAITGTETGGPGGGRGGGRGGGHGSEEALTGDTADKVEAAVLAKYPDATIERMETDADGSAYEAHIQQADGTRATVKLDDSFAITGTETGGPGGGRHGDHSDDDATSTDDSSTSSTSGA
jgi:uncharacterized membrane protein YkoI